jgi:hypothetical protein
MAADQEAQTKLETNQTKKPGNTLNKVSKDIFDSGNRSDPEPTRGKTHLPSTSE